MKNNFYYADGGIIRLDQFNFFTYTYTNKMIEILGHKNFDDEKDNMTIIERLSLSSYHDSFENPTYLDFELVFHSWCEIHLGERDTWDKMVELIRKKVQDRDYYENKKEV